MKNSTYRDAISNLPPPSTEQTRRFAEYVSEAHSWYKHLPLYPYSRFCFFLDPNAGQQIIQTPRGQASVVAVTESSERFHYSTKLTNEYRDNFGHWNYFAPFGTSFRVNTKQGVVDTRSSSAPRILVSGKGYVPVPDDLISVGSADITSLIHPHRNLHLFWAWSAGNSETIVRYPQLFDKNLDNIPAKLMSAMKYYCDLEVRRSEIPPDRWPKIASLDKEAEEIMNTTINPLLDTIRKDQLQNMEDSMNRFIRLIY